MTGDRPVRIAIIGAPAVSDYHHAPANRLDRCTELVAVRDCSQALDGGRQNDRQVDFLTVVVCPPSKVDDRSCLIGEFACGAMGVWEGTALAIGRDLNGFGHEWAEVGGSEGLAVYRLHEPNTILLGRTGEDLAPVAVPDEYLKPTNNPRVLGDGEPATVFRYDVVWEFVSAITEQRDAIPSSFDGICAQVVANNVLASYDERRW
ncbi:MAG: hypothetical protein QGH33_20700, partial [Pirellulaceae bacterium]|nr:hypothetical protein [Pirellulaceae bacterium]